VSRDHLFFGVALKVIRWDGRFVFGESVSATAVPTVYPSADYLHQLFQWGPLIFCFDDLGHRPHLPILLSTPR
jgi:hypothetical protein